MAYFRTASPSTGQHLVMLIICPHIGMTSTIFDKSIVVNAMNLQRPKGTNCSRILCADISGKMHFHKDCFHDDDIFEILQQKASI